MSKQKDLEKTFVGIKVKIFKEDGTSLECSSSDYSGIELRESHFEMAIEFLNKNKDNARKLFF
jgi:hypothetical protein